MLKTFDIQTWHEPISKEITEEAINALESGQVLFLPSLSFNLLPHERDFLSSNYTHPKIKNISYDSQTHKLGGAVCTKNEEKALQIMLNRYAIKSTMLMKKLFPAYLSTLITARTSYRPVEITGRIASSYRKDDTRLHVDAFPANPTRGKRILRIFSNVNPDLLPRVWRLGDNFTHVVSYFYPKLTKPFPGSSTLLQGLRITRKRRTLYDHYMLKLHNAMKADLIYQQEVPQKEVKFPANSTWIVYTDQVSHAAMAGQFTFEQTFYLPPQALFQDETSPLRILEKTLGKNLL